MRRIDLLHAHGSPTRYLYEHHGCRCVACRAANRERHHEYVSNCRARHREHERNYRVEHREEIAVSRSVYAATHREEKAAYAAAHRAEGAARGRNRRARKRSAPGSHTAADLLAQYERQKGRCFYCKTRLGDSYHDEHVTPIILGGSNGLENIVAACPTCNQRKHAKHPMDFAGLLC